MERRRELNLVRFALKINERLLKLRSTIEKVAKNVVESDFSAELKAGKVVFKTVNVDNSKNLKLAEKFEASGTALFIYNGKTGQAIDLTDAGFSYAKSDEAKLRGLIRTAIRNNLSQL